MKSLSNKSNNKAFFYSVILLSISLILGYVEAMFPFNFGIMGIKIGLPNIVTLIALIVLDTKRTFFINILRILILGIVFSNIIRFIISLSGFLLSFIVMSIAVKRLSFSILVSSILGGVFHNIGQVLSVSIITKNAEILKIMYLYIIIGIISGFVVGIISSMCLEKLDKVIFE